MFRGLFSSIRDSIDRVGEFVGDLIDRVTGAGSNDSDDQLNDDIEASIDDLQTATIEAEAAADEGDEDEREEAQDLLAEIEEARAELEAARDELEAVEDDVQALDIEELARDAVEAGQGVEDFADTLRDLGFSDEDIAEGRSIFEDLELAPADDAPDREPINVDEQIEEAYADNLDEDDFYNRLLSLGLDEDQAFEGLERYIDFQVERYNERLDEAIERAKEAADIGQPIYELVDQLSAEGFTQGQIGSAFDAYFEELAIVGTAQPYEESGAFREDELDDDDEYRKTVATLEEAQDWASKVPTGKFVRRVDDDGEEWFDLYAKDTTL